MAICTEKPDVPLDPIGLEAVGDQPHYPLTCGGSGRHRTSSTVIPSPISQQASTSDFRPNPPGGFTMGNFSTPMSNMTSEERFAISQRSTSSTVISPGMPFDRSGLITHNSSQDGPDGKRTRNRTRTKRNKIRAANASNNQAAEDQMAQE